MGNSGQQGKPLYFQSPKSRRREVFKINQEYTISELRLENLEEALSLVWKVFLAYEAPEYSDEGVQEFRGFICYESIKQKLLDHQLRMWICVRNNEIVGVLAARPPCHISLLFVDGAHHQRGIARALLSRMVDYCKSNHEIVEITVNSSPYAKEAYRKLGFTGTGPEQTANGIRFIPMSRQL